MKKGIFILIVMLLLLTGTIWLFSLDRWDWSDPAHILAFVTAVVAAAIPLFLWRIERAQVSRDRAIQESQAKSLDRQEQISRWQRYDVILEAVSRSDNETHLKYLGKQIREMFKGEDGKLLRSAFRANGTIPLPGVNGQ